MMHCGANFTCHIVVLVLTLLSHTVRDCTTPFSTSSSAVRQQVPSVQPGGPGAAVSSVPCLSLGLFTFPQPCEFRQLATCRRQDAYTAAGCRCLYDRCWWDGAGAGAGWGCGRGVVAVVVVMVSFVVAVAVGFAAAAGAFAAAKGVSISGLRCAKNSAFGTMQLRRFL